MENEGIKALECYDALPKDMFDRLMDGVLAASDEVSWSRETRGAGVMATIGMVSFSVPFMRKPWDSVESFKELRAKFSDQFITDVAGVNRYGDGGSGTFCTAAHYRLEGPVAEHIKTVGFSFPYNQPGLEHPAFYKKGKLVAYTEVWDRMLVWGEAAPAKLSDEFVGIYYPGVGMRTWDERPQKKAA